MFVAVDGRLAGAITLVDTPRPHARRTLDLLGRLGIARVVMLTGDRVESARGLAEALGVREFHAALTPIRSWCASTPCAARADRSPWSATA